MSGVTLAVVAFMLGLVAMAFAFAGGAVIVAVPVALIGVGVAMALELKRRRQEARSMQSFRDEAQAENVEFTARDQETLASSD